MTNSSTVGIVIALIIGAVGGYLISGVRSSSSNGASMKASESATTQKNSEAQSTPPKTNEEKIANAMSAALDNVSKDATILDWPPAEGKEFVSLRKGSNGWTCLPDDPTTPGNDPVCVDGEAMKFFGAWMSKTKPKLAQAGIGYMLQGGATASNDDPFATTPKAGEDWMHAPPHLMVFPVTPPDPKVYGTSPDSGGPWVMWPNTPYAHLMIPVK